MDVTVEATSKEDAEMLAQDQDEWLDADNINSSDARCLEGDEEPRAGGG